MRKQRNPAPDPPKSGEKVPSSSRGAHSSYQEKLARYLIVNADDFGQSTGINKGVIQAHEEGIVTSASLMVRWPAAPEAAAYARNRPGLSVGLHVDLCEWMFSGYEWVPMYQVVSLQDARGVRAEVERQLGAFRQFLGKGPTHIDSHQHVHREEPARSILLEISRKLGVPLREYNPHVCYCGDFYGQTEFGSPFQEGISIEGLVNILIKLKPGITEISCHPGVSDDPELTAMYRIERGAELMTLCDPIVRQYIKEKGIICRSFRNMPDRVPWAVPPVLHP